MNLVLLATMDSLVESVDEPCAVGNHGFLVDEHHAIDNYGSIVESVDEPDAVGNQIFPVESVN